MHDQPKSEPLEVSRFFTDRQASRSLIEGTVARGQLREDRAVFAGLDPEGNFVTDIQGAPDVFSLLGTALATGTSRAATVDLTIELGRGTLRERHTANLAVLAEPPSTGYEFVVAVVGEGVVLPGTGIYEHASGTSSLLLVFEVDAESQLPPVVRTGTLRFDID